MSSLTTKDVSEKRISLVYNSDITGFQPIDFSKIDGIESLLTSGISVTANVGIASQADVTQFGEWVANGFHAAQPTIAVIGSSAGQPFPISGTVTTIQQKKSNISNFTVSGTNGTALRGNVNREELFVQNLQTGNLYVKYGTSAASNSFNFVLASSTVSGGGDGGSLSDLNYTGIVSVSGLNSSYICWERS